MQPLILVTEQSKDYELLDSGSGAKLERFGGIVVARPDPEALWQPADESLWKNADATYVRKGNSGSWKFSPTTPAAKRATPPPTGGEEIPFPDWKIEMNGFIFSLKPTAFKHVGIFPEQSLQWKWIEETIQSATRETPVKVLNLFGYTGGATMASLRSGAEVVHVDASKVAVSWAKENAELSLLGDKPVRWILDDAFAFIKRELRRGNKYDAIIMDPPAFGRGPKGEEWVIEKQFAEFMEDCMKLLSENPLFFLVNGYSAGYSPVAYRNTLLPLVEKYGGKLEHGELAIQESTHSTSSGQATKRLLPAGIFARWRK